MAKVPITIMGFRCDRCGHQWIPRDIENPPEVCPSPTCKSPYWDRPRKRAMMTYEEFRLKVERTLKDHGTLTWTELRTAAKLPQAFPNNQWVHRMEKDLGLSRKRDNHGIIRWSVG